MSDSRRDFIQEINKIIKELEAQKEDLEFIFNILKLRNANIDNLISQYFLLWKMKNEMNQLMVTLPPEERIFFEQELDLKRNFEYYEEQINLAILRHGELITINQALSMIKNIDRLVLELKKHLIQYDRGSREALPKIKDILKLKVGPFLFGSAMIGVDVYLKNIPTIIAGIYIIYNALVIG